MKQPKATALPADTRGTKPVVAAVAAQAVAHAARLRATARAAQIRVTARAARFRATGAGGPLGADITGVPLEPVVPLKDAVPLEPVVPLKDAAPLMPAGAAGPLNPVGLDDAAMPLKSAAPLKSVAPLKPVAPDALAALRRVRASAPAARPEAPVVERCELCAVPVAPEHRHVVSLDSRALLCACRPCSLLFEHPEAKLAYRTVPDRHLALPPLPRQQWDSLGVPVGLAFVFRNSRQARTVVCYPGPAGATEADLPIDASEAFGDAVPDVEAVLIRARGDAFDRFIVPIDACYALVGHLRTLWRGFDGGPEAHARVAEFFADIERKAVRTA